MSYIVIEIGKNIETATIIKEQDSDKNKVHEHYRDALDAANKCVKGYVVKIH